MRRILAAAFVAFALLPLASCGDYWGDGGGGGDDGIELVRVRISDMNGSEPGTISSVSHPALFDLDPRIAFVELTFLNPEAPVKNDVGPARWQPALTPLPPAVLTAGIIELTITPVVGSPVGYDRIRFTSSARFSANPSSLRLQSSEDGFASTLLVIDLDSEHDSSVSLATSISDAPFVFRWEAHNDFGEHGGGESGFSSRDIVVTEATP